MFSMTLSLEAQDILLWGTLVATHDDTTPEDEGALKSAIDQFLKTGGTAAQVVHLLGRAGRQAYLNHQV